MRYPFLIFSIVILTLPVVVFGQENPYSSLVQLPSFDGGSGATRFSNYINFLYVTSISLAALLAVIKIIIAGVKYMLTDVVPAKGEALKDIRTALLGLLLIVGAVLILNVINPNLATTTFEFEQVQDFQDNTPPPTVNVVGGTTQVTPPAGGTTTGGSGTTGGGTTTGGSGTAGSGSSGGTTAGGGGGNTTTPLAVPIATSCPQINSIQVSGFSSFKVYNGARCGTASEINILKAAWGRTCTGTNAPGINYAVLSSHPEAANMQVCFTR